MWAAITAIFTALAEWLRLKQVSAAYDLRRRIEADIAADEDDILRLRARGNPSDHERADRLRERILRAEGVAADLSAPRASAGGAPASADA